MADIDGVSNSSKTVHLDEEEMQPYRRLKVVVDGEKQKWTKM